MSQEPIYNQGPPVAGADVWRLLNGPGVAEWIADGLTALEAWANGGWQPEYFNPETGEWETDQ